MTGSGRAMPKFKCKDCPIRNQPEWGALSAEELDFVTRSKRDQVFEPGEVIYHQGDPCEGMFWIRSGLVGERRIDPDCEMAMVRLSHTGSALGYQELLTRTPYRNSAEALKETRTCFVSAATLRTLLDSNAALNDGFLRRTVHDLEMTEDNYVTSLKRGVRTRMLEALLELYELYGRFDPEKGHVLEIPLTRKDLAALVGTGPEVLSRTIRKLEQDKVARFEGRTVVFADLPTLQSSV